ncbi:MULTISPECIES: formate hydrogenlyase maturation HycH family protein [Rhodopseudomonas]|uniref:Formate hydrogenlyase maturation protein HycH n=1 Tax=Rhodopseudomonas palustris TaxID=1076 RepID=A0A0D7EQU4_RHOPL|nr:MULTISPECIES: formate hydrogenlyase maturation HycH family protein [Rhodopseudomonas]KIZ43168.1 formate hydrogenlyase maturation protein HycH [Rhodopseudomonas palustris]MDF3811867.1 formate hydrogenlyase maturation HycH family protein [Rhodopseudomonas sp. BAL398]WOK19735.1 formate hydrogenlyase maturation HycH family protein [Rhodopseudomonas sp. BAL398]
MSGDIVFYRLNAKILDRAEDVPDDAKQVVYYSLAIGHHVGVFDCFKPVLRCAGDFYPRLVDALPAGEARRKLDGMRRFGEITIDRSHTALLGEAIEQAAPGFDPEVAAWFKELSVSLAAIEAEPAIYLMGRRL